MARGGIEPPTRGFSIRCFRADYSEKTAKEIAAQNLSKLNIAEAIQLGMSERSKRTEITADYVLNTIVETIECDSLSNDY